MSPMKKLVEDLQAEGKAALELYGAEGAAKAFQRAVAKVEEVLAQWLTGEVNLQGASDICGYSSAQLRRKIRDGKLRDYGRVNAPRLRVSELPFKAAYVSPLLGGAGTCGLVLSSHVECVSPGLVSRRPGLYGVAGQQNSYHQP